MNLKLLAGLTAVAVLACVGSYQWAYHQAWDEGRQALAREQNAKAQARLEKQITRQQQNDARAAVAEQEGAVKTQTITREVVKYIRTPGRSVCTFDEARVKLKAAAVENANSIKGYDHE